MRACITTYISIFGIHSICCNAIQSIFYELFINLIRFDSMGYVRMWLTFHRIFKRIKPQKELWAEWCKVKNKSWCVMIDFFSPLNFIPSNRNCPNPDDISFVCCHCFQIFCCVHSNAYTYVNFVKYAMP